MRDIAFVFFQRFTSQAELESLMKRLEIYSIELYKQHGNVLNVHFFQESSQRVGLVTSSTLRVIPYGFGGFKLLRAFKILYCISGHTRFIAGNLWKDFPILIFLKFLRIGRVWIQISIHGELNSKNSSTAKRLYKQLIAYFFRFADSVRFVSSSLENDLAPKLKLAPNKVFISPIPTRIRTRDHSSVPNKALCYLGRIHHERDYKMWAKIAKMIHRKIPNSQFIIIGAGTGSNEFSKLLLSEIPIHDVHFKGFLNHDQLVNVFDRFHILLSTAPSEGYGLALREAGLENKYVVARQNSGTTVLAQKYPETYLLFKTEQEAVELIEKIWHREKNLLESALILEDILRLNHESLTQLVNSWTRYP
jgi:glycosyltransferase involved in cell wall biosynthesis